VFSAAALVLVIAPALGPAGRAQTKKVTFSKDIAPILQRSCQSCHHPNSVAPMSLVSYEEVRPWARSIKLRTGLRNRPDAMPPWYIEKDIGIQQFKDDMSLSEEDIDKIAAWVDGGAPRGNPADEPKPLSFAGEGDWRLGKPDLIVTTRTVDVSAGSPDWWGPIGEAPTGLAEDRYVASVEIREINDAEAKGERQTIGGRYVFHHLVYLTTGPAGEPESGGARWPPHSVGRNADVFDPDAGKLLRAGSKVVFNSAHMHSRGTDTRARVEIGFKFHPHGYKPKRDVQGGFGGVVRDLDIRGNEGGQRFEAYSTLTEHTKLISYEPHMHAAGVRMCLEAIWGTTVETLNCSGYNHSWVRVYNYMDDAAPLLPKGTILRLTGYFDNTPANKNISDPRNWQGMGHRTVDNMMFNLGSGYSLTEEEFQQELAKRRQNLHLTAGQTVIGCPLCATNRPAAAAANQQP
jgi:mono/diheme cytochrome c family protein